MAGTDKLKELLAVYNSISPSRRRWIRNRVGLRQSWKELFEALEEASGRPANKVALYDENWHEISDKGGAARGPVNKSIDDVNFGDLDVEETAAANERNKQSKLEAEGGDMTPEGDKLRDIAEKSSRQAEAQKDVKTAPSHVAALGEEPKTKAENKSDIEGDPSTTETNGDEVDAPKVDDRLPQERLAEVDADESHPAEAEAYDTKGLKNGSAEQTYPVQKRPEVNNEEGDAPEGEAPAKRTRKSSK